MNIEFIRKNPELFLEGLDGFKQEMFKEYLFKCCDKVDNGDQRFIEYWWYILPITRRIIQDMDKRVDFSLDDLMNLYIESMPIFDKLNESCSEFIDVEAEYCYLISKIMIGKIKNK